MLFRPPSTMRSADGAPLLLPLILLGLAPLFMAGCELYTCQDNQFCLFKDNDYDYRYQWQLNVNDSAYRTNTWPWAGGEVNNSASSVVNNSAAWVAVYDQVGYGGTTLCVAPGAFWPRLDDGDFDNVAGSHKWGNANQPPDGGLSDCDLVISTVAGKSVIDSPQR